MNAIKLQNLVTLCFLFFNRSSLIRCFDFWLVMSFTMDCYVYSIFGDPSLLPPPSLSALPATHQPSVQFASFVSECSATPSSSLPVRPSPQRSPKLQDLYPYMFHT